MISCAMKTDDLDVGSGNAISVYRLLSYFAHLWVSSFFFSLYFTSFAVMCAYEYSTSWK